jgi:hypothetical protein
MDMIFTYCGIWCCSVSSGNYIAGISVGVVSRKSFVKCVYPRFLLLAPLRPVWESSHGSRLLNVYILCSYCWPRFAATHA